MSRVPVDPAALPEPTRAPMEGWHCTHIYYRFDRAVLAAMPPAVRSAAREDFLVALDPATAGQPARLQSSITSGHRADFGLMLMDADPLVVDGVHQRLLAGRMGPALVAAYSFVSLTEVSEYVPTLERFQTRLRAEGLAEGTPEFERRVKGYAQREPIMRRARLTPDLPTWPATCFYPMNKKRKLVENWFLLPFEERDRMMAEHAESGMKFAGRVTQLITVGVGLDDWEWGVTLWARSPQFLKDIVYTMRFDEASARYAEFGPFYAGYLASAAEILDHCRIGP